MVKEYTEDLSSYFKKLAEEYVDKTEEEIEKDFNEMYEKVSKSPSMATKPEIRKINRAKTKMAEKFRSMKRDGKRFVFIPFGNNSTPKNWNGKEIADIINGAKTGLLPKLIREEKVLCKSTPAGMMPVSSVKEWGKRKVYIKDGHVYLKETEDSTEVEEKYVIDGTDLKPGQDVIPRDSRIYMGKGNTINFNWSGEMKPNYSCYVWGIGYEVGNETDTRMIRFILRNEQANPFSSDYFFRRYPAFRIYEGTFTSELKNSVLELSYIGKLLPDNGTITGVDDNNIDEVIEANLEDIREKYRLEGSTAFVPNVIYISGIKKYHISACIKDSVGNVVKNKSGWDTVNYDSYAILLADFERAKYATDITDDKRCNNWYLFSDVDEKTGAFGDRTQFNMVPIMPGTPTISTITTSRGVNKYDPRTKKNNPDPENADISVKVFTIRPLPRVEIELGDSFED